MIPPPDLNLCEKSHTPPSELHAHSEYLGNDVVEIQLDARNYCKGYLPSGQSLLCLFDSGATQSLIGSGTVCESSYLSKLPKIDIDPVKFRIGNGEFLYAKQAIKPHVKFQGKQFKLFTIIAENFAGPDILLGTSTLKELRGSLDFVTNTFKVRPKKTWFSPTSDVVIRPGQARIIHVKGRLPKHMKNSAVLVQSTPFLARFCPTSMLLKFQHSIAPLRICNNTSKPLFFKHGTPIAVTNLENFVHVTESIPLECIKPSQPVHSVSSTQASNLKRYPHLTPDDPESKFTTLELLKQGINLKDSILTTDQKSEFYNVLAENHDAFSLYGEVGTCPNFEVDIHLTDTSPFYIRPYPVSDDQKRLIDKELTKLVKLGILQQGHTPYTSPVLLVKKKDTNDRRVVCDLRYLNSRCVSANSDVVTISDILQKLGKSNCKVFSVLDLKSAFHCLKLSPSSMAYTGLASYRGGPTYFHKKLPMGLKISTSVFSQKINNILSKIPNSSSFCQAVHDDILVYSETVELHFKHLSLILQALVTHGLKVSAKKCKFFSSSVVYLGHRLSISSEGHVQITALNDRCAAIRKMKAPTNVRGVRRFIGAVMYLSSFLPKLQTLLCPLHELTRKHHSFHWDSKHETAFQDIKELLITPPVLYAPTGKGKLRLYCDTSRVATGSYLAEYHANEDREYIIAYYSKRLPPAAKNYSVSELELMGIYLSVSCFRYMLLGQDFQVFCDHSALIHIFKSKKQPPTTRLQKLLERLSEYCFQLAYIKGSDIVLSDFLSRAPIDDDDVLDRIIPIAFSAEAIYDLESLAEPVSNDMFYNMPQPEKIVTRSYAKKMNIQVPPLHKVRPKPQPRPRKSTDANVRPSVPTNTAPQHDIPKHVDQNKHVLPTATPVHTDLPPLVLPQLHPVPPKRVIPPSKPITTTVNEPRLIDTKLSSGHLDEVSDDISDLLKEPQPLIPQIDNLQTQHITDQNSLNKVLNVIKKRVIRDYNLPLEAQQFSMAQQTSAIYKSIYDYLAHAILPSDKKSARVIMIKSEQYFLCNGILFRLFFPPNGDSFDYCLQLAVPEKYIDTIIGMHHGAGLLLGHGGCTRTYLTMRKNYYFPGMFQRIVAYIQSCNRCQEIKGKRDMARTFHERIPKDFEPFETISIDFKSMPVSPTSFRHLMVVTCSMTRFIVAVPLKTLDAPTVCEALIQKVLTVFGIPSVIITDQAATFTSQLVELLCSTLGIQQKLISVGNHGSLMAERQIRSIADLIKSNLNIYGKSWTQFVSTSVYTYNSFSSAHLGGYSPFYLLFLRQPAQLAGLHFKPCDGLSRSHKEYVEHLQQKFQNVSRCMLQLQEHQQLAQNVKLANKLNKAPVYAEGQLVYLHKPNTKGMTANSRKFKTQWVGPLAVHQALDQTHYILADLKGNIIPDIFNHARLKPAYLRATGEKNVDNVQQLRDLLRRTKVSNDETATVPEKDSAYIFSDEKGHFHQPSSEEGIIYTCDDSDLMSFDISKHHAFLSLNDGLLAPTELNAWQKKQQSKCLRQSPSESDLSVITKARFNKGRLEILISVPCGETQYNYWWSPLFDQQSQKLVELVLKSKDIKCSGSVSRYTTDMQRKKE